MSGTQITRASTPWALSRKLFLSVGFLALAVATLVAWSSPASAYEVSIYHATPSIAWVGIALAIGMAALVCMINPRDRLAGTAIFLGGASMMTTLALPAIRNYRYFGTADAMTHLGWAEDIRSGVMGPTELIYPAGHLLTVVLGEVFGIETSRAVFFTLLLLLGVYLISIPLIARAIVGVSSVTVIAAFAGFFLLPFNNISTVLNFHTYSFAVLLVPFFLFVLIRFLLAEGAGWGSWQAWTPFVLLAGGGVLLLHPQVKLNVIIVIGVIAVVYLLARIRWLDHPLSEIQPVYGVFGLLTLAWIGWSRGHWQLGAAADNLLTSAINTLRGEEAVGQTTTEIGASATAIGITLWELFAKLFLVSTIMSVVALGVVVLAISETFDRHARRDYAIISYIGIAGIVLTPFFFLHYLGEISAYFFRHLGFGMVLITIVASIGLYYLAQSMDGHSIGPTIRMLGVWLFAIALVISVLAVFASPYIYLASGHVSDAEANGYEIAIENSDPTVAWSGVRSGPGRFFDGLTPELRPATADGGSVASEDELERITDGAVTTDTYLPVSTRDREREVRAYHELHFTDEAFNISQTNPRTHHIQTNGEFDLYYIPAAGS